jgi:cysteine desulfurase/selenocysteine lyase
MFGPTGIGVLYGKTEWLEKLPPYQSGGEMISRVTFEKTTYNDLPFRLEAGTPHISGAIGLAEAIAYLNTMDRQAALEYEQSLTEYATDQLLSIQGLRIIGEAEHKASLISFIIDGLHPSDIGTILDHEGVAVRTGHHCTQPLMDLYGIPGTVRASMCFYNTIEDIDRLVAGTERAVKMLKG